jgi:hypothetical protein
MDGTLSGASALIAYDNETYEGDMRSLAEDADGAPVFGAERAACARHVR